MLKIIVIYLITMLYHPVHVSMTGIHKQTEGEAYTMTVRMFSDDLLLDMVHRGIAEEEHITDHSFIGPDELLEAYINDRIEIIINGSRHKADIKEVEKLELETVMKLEIDFKGTTDSLTVHNRILTSVYNDQINLLIYKDMNNEIAVKFTPDHVKEEILSK